MENDPLAITSLPRGSIPVKIAKNGQILVHSEKVVFFVAWFFLSHFFRFLFLIDFRFSRALEQNSLHFPVDSELNFVISTLKDEFKNIFYPYENHV